MAAHSGGFCVIDLFLFSWDETKQDFYYFNFESGQSQWEHPLDAIFLERVAEARNHKHFKEPKEFLDPDVTEISGDTSDLLSAEVQKGDQSQIIMDLNAPQKLVRLNLYRCVDPHKRKILLS